MRLCFGNRKEEIPLEVVYRRRKTMEIRVEGPDQVKVIAPHGTSRQTILDWVEMKSAWLSSKLLIARQTRDMAVIRKQERGDALLYLGSYLPVEMEFDAAACAPVMTLLPDSILIRTRQPHLPVPDASLEAWYRGRTRDLVMERMMAYQSRIPVTPGRITIKSQRSRWGSCSSKGNLNFNWKIAFLPDEVIDYIVVHELCHLVHLNHSRDYWDLVASILPDYKVCRGWLRRHPLLNMPFRENE